MPGKRFKAVEIDNNLWLSDVVLARPSDIVWLAVAALGAPNLWFARKIKVSALIKMEPTRLSWH